MTFEYQGFATLGVNLNRQKYGPLDVSAVFLSEADLNYYITGIQQEGMSEYWKGITPYPYPGQIISLLKNSGKEVIIYKLVATDNNGLKYVPVGGNVPEGVATEEFVKEEIDKINFEPYATKDYVKEQIAQAELGGVNGEVDLSIFYTKSEVDEKIAAIPQSEALSMEEICGVIGDEYNHCGPLSLEEILGALD